jgi:hypothetical protein
MPSSGKRAADSHLFVIECAAKSPLSPCFWRNFNLEALVYQQFKKIDEDSDEDSPRTELCELLIVHTLLQAK